jgi:DNA ligase-1
MTSCVQLIPALLDHPLSELADHVHFMPGVPVKPMLAKPTTGVGEVLDKFTGCEFTCEYKYDGERVQVRWWQKEEGFRFCGWVGGWGHGDCEFTCEYK